MVRIVDLSVPIERRSKSEPFPAKITFWDHKEGARRLGLLYDTKAEEFPDGKGLAWEELVVQTHTGTHLDAPWHFGDTAEGKPSKTIDEVPLEWCFGDGVVLDFSSKDDGAKIMLDDVKKELARINYHLKAGDIVLIRTDRDKKFGSRNYTELHPGMTREATLWILAHEIKIIGTDGYGFDRPFALMFEEYKKTGDNSALWPAHFAGRDKEYCHIEKLANLDQLPPFGFKVAVFPIKIKNASAGWVRPVAIFSD